MLQRVQKLLLALVSRWHLPKHEPVGYTARRQCFHCLEDVMHPVEPSLPTRTLRIGFLRQYMPYKGFHMATCYP